MGCMNSHPADEETMEQKLAAGEIDTVDVTIEGADKRGTDGEVGGRDRVSTRGGISSAGTEEDMGDKDFVMQNTPKSAEVRQRAKGRDA